MTPSTKLHTLSLSRLPHLFSLSRHLSAVSSSLVFSRSLVVSPPSSFISLVVSPPSFVSSLLIMVDRAVLQAETERVQLHGLLDDPAGPPSYPR